MAKARLGLSCTRGLTNHSSRRLRRGLTQALGPQVQNRFKRIALCALAGSLLASCSGHDDDFFPYRMKGLDVWLYDAATETDIYVGFVEASYTSRQEGLASCAATAATAAAARNLREWSHVCCTVTSESKCATKVR